MQPLIGLILKRQPVDRIGLFEHFWSDTRRAWEQMDYVSPDASLEDLFGFDMQPVLSNRCCRG